MLSSIIDLLWLSIENAFTWFIGLFSSFGLVFFDLILSVILIFALYKFVLSPYLSGSGSSDSAKNSKGKGKKG